MESNQLYFIHLFPLKFFTIRNQTAQVPRFDGENREPCENHGLSRNCNHQKGFATNVHCPEDGKDGKTVKVRIPAFAD